ncbi:MAG: hypothetical protein AB7F91_00255 [Parvularculaceae bacterium]
MLATLAIEYVDFSKIAAMNTLISVRVKHINRSRRRSRVFVLCLARNRSRLLVAGRTSMKKPKKMQRLHKKAQNVGAGSKPRRTGHKPGSDYSVKLFDLDDVPISETELGIFEIFLPRIADKQMKSKASPE